MAVRSSAYVFLRSTRPVGSELAIRHVAGDDRPFALILGQPATTGSCPQPLGLHEPFDPMQAAGDAFGEQVMPDTAGTIGAVAANMAGPDPCTDHFIVPATLR